MKAVLDMATTRDELAQLRRSVSAQGCFSWTSEAYQNDVLSFIGSHTDAGWGIIEVGCYKGGLSAQLALVCEKLGWPYYGIDIDPGFLDITLNLFAKVGVGASATLFAGTLESFTEHMRLVRAPLAVVIDADHAYEAVRRDIGSLYRLNKPAYAAMFHDYSLRHPRTGEAVDQAIRWCFGDHLPVQRIGRQHDGTASGPTKEHPQPDGHYWEIPGSEGALVILPNRLARD